MTGALVASMGSASRTPRWLSVWIWLVLMPATGTAAGCRQSDADADAAASSEPRSAPKQPGDPTIAIADREQKHSVGQAAQSTDYVVTLRNVKECPVETHLKPRPGNIKLGVELSFEGTGKREVPVNPFYATIGDSKGNSYNCTFGGCEPQLQSSRIRQGDRAGGWVTFEIPKQATGLTLEYSPFVIGSGKQTVRFDLGR